MIRGPGISRGLAILNWLPVLALGGWAGPAAGQTLSGMVAEQISLAGVRGAVVALYQQSGEGDLRFVARAATDDLGVFSFTVPGPGTYRVQAELNGLSTALSDPIGLATADARREDVALLLPSPLLRSALLCQAQAGDSVAAVAAVVGMVRDSASGVGLPGTRVEATWQEGRMVRRLQSETDAAGRYRLCPPANAGKVDLQSFVLGHWSHHGLIDLTGPAVVMLDLLIPAAAAPREALGLVQERTLQAAGAGDLSDVRGELVDASNGAPVPFAVVRLEGTSYQAVADQAGRFSLEGLRPGRYKVEVRSIGYVVASDTVEVPAGKDVYLGLRVAPQAVEIEGLVVTARAASAEGARATPFRRDVVAGERMEVAQRRGAMAFEVVRTSSPSVRVREIYREGGPPILCVESTRGVGTFGGAGSLCRNPVQVIVDGMRIVDGGEFLRNTPASELESVEFLSPMRAQLLFGIGGEMSNGAVVVYTRGRGPYAGVKRK